MNNDTVGNFLIQIKNAYMARRKTVEAPYANIRLEIANILKREKYIEEVSVKTDGDRKSLFIKLLYVDRKPAIEGLKRISKPGLRRYVGRRKMPRVYGGLGVAIMSTPGGIMTSHEAKKKNVGGEVICTIW